MAQAIISDADIVRSRNDRRFRQVLLAKVLEQLLAALHRLQNRSDGTNTADIRNLREGALMAVRLADLIRALDDELRLAATA